MNRTKLITLLAALALLLVLVPGASAASTRLVAPGGSDSGDCTGAPCATISYAVGQAVAGDTVSVAAGTYVVAANINLNKADLTLTGAGSSLTKLQVSGTGDRLTIAASGVTLKDFEIEKTDKAGVQEIIRVANGNGVTIKNNKIHGQFVIGDGDVSRAIVVNAGAFAGLNIEGNTVYALRQPAYISGSHTGTIQNNYVYSTKGWVVEGGNLTFTGNTWGTGANANVYDIAILATVGAGPYPNIVAMSNANNGAVIEDQRVSPAVLSVAYVDASTSYTTDLGGRYHPYSTIAPAITRVVAGGTINVAAGTYVQDLVIDKAVTLLGPNAAINPNTGIRVTEAVLYPLTSAPDPAVCENMVYLKVSNVMIKGFTFDGDNPALTSGVTINGADVDACEILAGYEGMGNIVVENNILKHATYAGIDFYNYTNPAATSGSYIRYNRFEDIGETTYNWGIGILLYNNFYAEVTNNILTGVRTGVQTGNYSQANPGAPAKISDNKIGVWRLGIFHNLAYSNASPFTISGNTIVAETYPGANKWNGLLLSSIGSPVNATITDNTITIPGAVSFPSPGYTAGYNVWNVTTSAPITIKGGTVTGGDYGVFVNNYEGYSSDANNTAVKIDGVAILGSNIAGVYVKDSPANTNGATVYANIQGCSIDTNATGILVEGADATAKANNSSIAGNTTIGVNNTTTTVMDATNNWWGAASGPGPVGPGSGDAVSTYVNFSPWLTTGLMPATCVVPVGEDVTLNTVLAGTNLYGYQFKINYDATKVSATGAFINDWFSTIGPDPSSIAWNHDCATEPGKCRYAVTLLNPAAPVNGAGVVASITLHGLAVGDLPLTYSDVLLSDRNATPLPATLTGAACTVQERITGLTVNAVPVNQVKNVDIAFTASKTTGDPVTYDWTFGDGATAANAGPTPSHAYSAKGDYLVKVRASNGLGFQEATVEVHIVDTPVSGLTMNCTTPVKVGVATSCTASATGDPVDYDWDWGDGTTHGSGTPASHAYATVGTKTVTVRAYNVYNEVTTSQTVVVYDLATVSGVVNLQGRPTDNRKSAGNVTLTDKNGHFTDGPTTVAYDIVTGAWSASVKALAGGTVYTVKAAHSVYLDNAKEVTAMPGAPLAAGTTTIKGGDANNNAWVFIEDLSCIGGAFGGAPSLCGTTGSSDINEDLTVNILDLVLAGGNYDLHSPQPW